MRENASLLSSFFLPFRVGIIGHEKEIKRKELRRFRGVRHYWCVASPSDRQTMKMTV
jgi:hypothetical protein